MHMSSVLALGPYLWIYSYCSTGCLFKLSRKLLTALITATLHSHKCNINVAEELFSLCRDIWDPRGFCKDEATENYTRQRFGFLSPGLTWLHQYRYSIPDRRKVRTVLWVVSLLAMHKQTQHSSNRNKYIRDDFESVHWYTCQYEYSRV